MTFSAAVAYCSDPWRLPTASELRVAYTKGLATTNGFTFGSAGANYAWSSDIIDASNAYVVYFTDGVKSSQAKTSTVPLAACVRRTPQDSMNSGIWHTSGTNLSLQQSFGLTVNELFGLGQHEVPKITGDVAPSFTITATTVVRPTYVCGKSGTTIAAKIADCGARNPAMATWYGTLGESWTLVTAYPINNGAFNDGTTCVAATSCREVWRDNRTQLVWSDTIGDYNWCHASGSNNKSGSPYAEVDPEGFCSDATYQDQTSPISVCAEDATYLTTPTDGDDDKGGLKAGTTPSVKWRLPSWDDWAVANTNGIRTSLGITSGRFWSSSVISYLPGSAFDFYGSYGGQGYWYREALRSVRCVARPAP
jgi:hypothetical protein